MNKIVIILCLPFLTFAQTKNAQRNNLIFKGPIYSNPERKIISNALPQWKDSLNYIVVRHKYDSGALFSETLEDKLTKIYYWKQFFPNGQLKEVGAMTKDEIICIGKWTYYDQNGNVDTTIDYDKMLSIPYFKALDIAMSYDFKMPDLDVDIVTIDDKQYWQFRKWIMKYGDGISSTILINTLDGSIARPKQEIEKHN